MCSGYLGLGMTPLQTLVSGLCHAAADETTALGEPKPGPQGRVQYRPQAINQGTSLLGLVGVGAGVGLVFAILGRIL